MRRERNSKANTNLASVGVDQYEMEKLFDSTLWDPCGALNYNHIFCYNFKQKHGYMQYEDGYIPPNSQLYYKDSLDDPKAKVVEFDDLYIRAMQDEYTDEYYILNIYFESLSNKEIYILSHHVPYCKIRRVEDIENPLAIKANDEMLRIQMKKGNIDFYEHRSIKIRNLGF